MGNTKKYTNITPEAWERQEGESSPAFQAFSYYRDMGADRSLAKVAKKCGKNISLMERWSARWQWGQRVLAWDDEQDRLVRESLTKGVTAMRKNHTSLALAMIAKALNALQRLPQDELSPRDISTMVDVAVKIERLSRGEYTEKTESKTTVAGELNVQQLDLSGLTNAELEQLDEIVGRISTG